MHTVKQFTYMCITMSEVRLCRCNVFEHNPFSSPIIKNVRGKTAEVPILTAQVCLHSI